MTEQNPTLQDIWRLLGTMNKRFDARFEAMEKQMVQLREEFADLKAHVTTSIGALRGSIEARDFRLDEHGRRISDLEARMDERSPT